MSERSTGGAVEHAHPGPVTYIKIAVVLAILTVTEVAVYYIPALSSIIVPLLITLSLAKFVLVIMYYMHLKYDPKLLSGIFLWGMFVAVAIVLAMIAIYAF